MSKLFRAAAFGLLLVAAQVHAAFHLWTMNELYSSADGTVQFLEMTALSGGQQFLNGQSLVTSNGAGTTHTFIFPADLPGDTAGKRMLIATQGYAALGGGLPRPDYTVPNGFFFQGGGSVNFANVDVWNHGALPAGNLSLNRNGSTAVNSPTNFPGTSGSVVPSSTPVLNFQGLWYKSPAESEAGWGVNVTHQGDIFFVTWFTYDADGSQMWLVGPSVRKTGTNTYAGDLFRTTGPAFNAVPFGAISFVQAGSVTFTFTDANNG